MENEMHLREVSCIFSKNRTRKELINKRLKKLGINIH